jgi:hypothetical protein
MSPMERAPGREACDFSRSALKASAPSTDSKRAGNEGDQRGRVHGISAARCLVIRRFPDAVSPRTYAMLKRFEGVGEISEGRARSTKTARRTAEMQASSPHLHSRRRLDFASRHSGASNLSLAYALRLRLEPATSAVIARDPRFEVTGSIRCRRHRSEPIAPNQRVTSSSCASRSCARSSLPLTWSLP